MSRPLTLDCLDSSVGVVVQRLMDSFAQNGGRGFLVGGAVRDALMGKEPKDLDFEVYGLEVEKLEAAIKAVAKFDAVGRSFGVYKLKGLPIDVALPRRESKTGEGHKAFEVVGDPNMSFEEACARRDFTINSILWDPISGELIDPYGGQKDLDAKLIRHTSPHFVEDPLRVLRAMQFVARFDFTVADQTVELCRSIGEEGLPPERLFEEWKKLILKGKRPSVGLKFLRECGWVKYYPELAALIDCEQEPEWHPEGDVWNHTLHCLDAYARQRFSDAPTLDLGENRRELLRKKGDDAAMEWEDLVVGFAVLCHDFGKPLCTEKVDGRIRSRGHDFLGIKPSESFLRRMTNHQALVDGVLPLVETHMRPRELFNANAGDTALRRLARKVGRIDRLVRVAYADMHGRPPFPVDFPEGPWLLEQASRLDIEDKAPAPIVMGRHLVDRGYKPSPAFKAVLNACYEGQLDGEFADLEGGLAFLEKYLAQKPL